MVFSGNPGLSFHRLRNPRLASEVADLIRQAAPPRLEIMGPARLRVGLYQKPGQLVLHVQNFIAWSGIEQFPYPVLAAPPPARNVVVRLHGVPIRAARVVAGDGGRRILVLESDADTVFLRLPVLRWGTVLALDLG
jgi:hypothetical protein